MADLFTREELFTALYRWLGIDHPSVSRRFLEMHIELLSPPAVFTYPAYVCGYERAVGFDLADV